QRLEFAGGYRNLSFDTKTRTRAFSTSTGELILDQEDDPPSLDTINMGTASTALVYDTSIFGGTSPILGRRYRVELAGVGGGLNYYSALLDFRQYIRIAKRLTLAGRFLHFGRYGGDAEDRRMQDMYIGYPALIRGYTFGSFEPRECDIGPNQVGSCPVFEQLLGSKMAVANVELRIPILGFFGLIPSSGVPPVETAIFFDAGTAWTNSQTTTFFGGDRSPVTSHGASLRFNIFGFAVGQLSYVHPNDRPLKSWHWSFSLIPGF
ncbi:MAG: BamA/TamA family outer membrane protein, partial [Bryobacteraceae bacterium]